MLMPTQESLRRATVAAPVRSTLCSTPLTSHERERINAGAWFASLSPALRHDIIRCASVRRYRSGDCIAAQSDTAAHWLACAKGTVRVDLVTRSGRTLTLDYVEPGQWLGEAGLLDDEPTLHDLHAHGDTTILHITRRDFMALFYAHEEFRVALLHKQRVQAKGLWEKVDDLKTLGLGARLAKILLELTDKHGESAHGSLHTGLQLPQRQLADWLGASRQRVNEHLKRMEKKNLISQGAGGLVVRDRAAMQAWAQSAMA